VQDLAPLAACTAVRTLHVDQCALAVFPPVATVLPSLAVLGLGNNAIPSIPLDVTRLARLSALDVRNNSIAALPPQLALLPLRSLLVDGNVLRSVRRAVLERGTPALLAYLKDRLPA
jgi:Leucine-rich repeat (LRR) protein